MTKVGILSENVKVILVLQFQREKTERERCEERTQWHEPAQRIQLGGSRTAGWRRGVGGAASPMSLSPTPPGMTRSLARSKGPTWPSVPRLRFRGSHRGGKEQKVTFQLSASVSGASLIPKKLRSTMQTEIKEVCFQGWGEEEWGGGVQTGFERRFLRACSHHVHGYPYPSERARTCRTTK